MEQNTGLTQKQRDGSIAVLNSVIADASVLYAKTRNYHWHVTGISFMELHKLFEAQYEQLAESVDEIAERTRQLGGTSLATLKEFLGATQLKEPTRHTLNARQMISDLLDDHESVIRALRKGIEACDTKYSDAGTADFLTGLLQEHEKTAWILRSYLR